MLIHTWVVKFITHWNHPMGFIILDRRIGFHNSLDPEIHVNVRGTHNSVSYFSYTSYSNNFKGFKQLIRNLKHVKFCKKKKVNKFKVNLATFYNSSDL